MSVDELTQIRQELEAFRHKLEEETSARQEELERFKEDTLWRLNALSDHSVELARQERTLVDTDLAKDRALWEERIALWSSRLSREIFNEAFLDSLAEHAFEELLPALCGAAKGARGP